MLRIRPISSLLVMALSYPLMNILFCSCQLLKPMTSLSNPRAAPVLNLVLAVLFMSMPLTLILILLMRRSLSLMWIHKLILSKLMLPIRNHPTIPTSFLKMLGHTSCLKPRPSEIVWILIAKPSFSIKFT